MPKSTQFKDFNFKLAVIEQLMYRKELLPPFDVQAFTGPERWKKIDMEKHSSRAIRDVKQFFKELEIPAGLLEQVEVIDQNYRKVYHQITPYWDGEGDEFNIKSVADLKLVPNVRQAILFYDGTQKMADAFREAGVDARYM